MFLGTILVIISGITAIILSVEKLVKAVTKLIVTWKNLIKAIKKSRP
ncbi:hypothetical protein ACPBEH_11455 (plasmid) [Latilactobacillus sp. 5-91]